MTHSSQASRSSVAFDVSGMTCKSCAANIADALKEQQGLHDYDIDLPGKRMHVTFDPNVTDASTIAQAITEAGYPTMPSKVS